MCESLKMREADLVSKAIEYQRLEKERDDFNIEVLQHVRDDIKAILAALALNPRPLNLCPNHIGPGRGAL